MLKKYYPLFTLALLLFLSACGNNQAKEIESLKSDVAETYANIVFASYQDSYNSALTLQEAVHTFVDNPSEESLTAAKTAWLAAREPYGQTEAYRFYNGPIDHADGPEGLLNAWPLDEAYVDYVAGAPTAGIINDTVTYPTIDAALLESLNEQGAEENISVGYHAIEFLLWGQDLSDDGPGNRPYTDYVSGGTADNQARRAQYLGLTADLLVEHLAQLKDAWDPAIEGNYRAEFLAQEPDEAIQKMLTGIGILSKSELAGERVFTAYDNQNQEDEHSCFSDNTHRDITANALGIYNVYMGQYTRLDGSTVSGKSLNDLLAVVDPALNAELTAGLEESLTAIKAMHIPFDQAISNGNYRPGVLNTVNILQANGDKIAQVATALEIKINTALPE